jgi:hypothetical protein
MVAAAGENRKIGRNWVVVFALFTATGIAGQKNPLKKLFIRGISMVGQECY